MSNEEESDFQSLITELELEISNEKLARIDGNNRLALLRLIYKFLKDVKLSEYVVINAHKVTEDLPNFNNVEQLDFWKIKVMPHLISNIEQDIKGRKLMDKSITAIENLSLILQETVTCINQPKITRNSLIINCKKIAGALSVLNIFTYEASKMERSAIIKFGMQLRKLFHIIGPKAANYAERIAEQYEELNVFVEKRNEYSQHLQNKRQLLVTLEIGIKSWKKSIQSYDNSLKNYDYEINEMHENIMKLERKINEIKVTVNKVKVEEGWTWYIFRWETISEYKGTNEMKCHEKHKLEENIDEKKNEVYHLRANQKHDAFHQKNHRNKLHELEKLYKKTIEEVKILVESLPEKITAVNGRIDEIQKKIGDIKQSEKKTSDEIGFSGDTLIKCLINVRLFARTLGTGISPYSPLISILKSVRTMVETDLELLNNGAKNEVLMVNAHLSQLVDYFGNITTLIRKRSNFSPEYKAIINPEKNITLP